MSDAHSAIRAIADDPAHSAILLDVDGTLAAIVNDPVDASVPLDVRRTLIGLGRRYALVACISGRTAQEARRVVGAGGLTYVGCHGSEVLRPGSSTPITDPALEPWAEQTRSAASAAMRELSAIGVRVEDKGSIAALHWRGTRDEEAAEAALKAIAADAVKAGLAVHWGRKVLELRPPTDFSKGIAVDELLADPALKRALYAGDDATDLDAFAALGRLLEQGRLESAARVAVLSAEAPTGLGDAADVAVDGPNGVAALLDSLLEAAGG